MRGFIHFSPLVVNLGIPQLVPALLIVDLGIEEQLQVIGEGGDLGNPRSLDLPNELRPDVVVVPFVLGERTGL
jgi:hypothetical protein